MSLIKHSFLPRSMFDVDLFEMQIPMSRLHHHMQPSTLDLFDPFDDLDLNHMLGRNFMWLNKPNFMLSQFMQPPARVPNKYRINVDCTGYRAQSIKIERLGENLVVSGSEGEEKKDGQDYTQLQFKHTYKLPQNVEADKLVSFLTPNSQLVIEIPLKDEFMFGSVFGSSEASSHPKIVDDQDGKSNQVLVEMPIPEGLDPSKIKVTCKDRDLIMQAEDKQEDAKDGSTRSSQTYYYRRCTLPENTDFDALTCVYNNNNRLTIKAPLIEQNVARNAVSIEINGNKV